MNTETLGDRIARLSPAKRRLLARLLEDDSFDGSWVDVPPTVSPRTPLEVELAAIWQEVLGVEELGVDDNFFDLGGDSILCVRIVARARSKTIPLTSRMLFEHPTIAEVARVLEGLETAPGLAAMSAGLDRPLRAAGWVPSPVDFPEAELTSDDLERILEQVAERVPAILDAASQETSSSRFAG